MPVLPQTPAGANGDYNEPTDSALPRNSADLWRVHAATITADASPSIRGPCGVTLALFAGKETYGPVAFARPYAARFSGDLKRFHFGPLCPINRMSL